jgi:hypothetical protein
VQLNIRTTHAISQKAVVFRPSWYACPRTGCGLQSGNAAAKVNQEALENWKDDKHEHKVLLLLLGISNFAEDEVARELASHCKSGALAV